MEKSRSVFIIEDIIKVAGSMVQGPVNGVNELRRHLKPEAQGHWLDELEEKAYRKAERNAKTINHMLEQHIK